MSSPQYLSLLSRPVIFFFNLFECYPRREQQLLLGLQLLVQALQALLVLLDVLLHMRLHLIQYFLHQSLRPVSLPTPQLQLSLLHLELVPPEV